jgi:ADP-heptose:LPS heptosyltransferase
MAYMPKKLVIRACAAGDFVLNLPALLAIQNLQPEVRFSLVGYPETLELARDYVHVEAIASIEGANWSRLFYGPVDGLSFDSAIVWMKDPAVAVNLRRSGIPNVLQADPFPQYGHAAVHLLRTLDLPFPSLPEMWSPSSGRIVIHPGSGSAKKNWPYFDELIRQIPDAYVLRGPAEGVEDAMPLRDVSRLLRESRGFIGNDSGITHLAAYLGVPTIALFGPTDPRIWGPIGRRSRVIWKRSLAEITVSEVLQAMNMV